MTHNTEWFSEMDPYVILKHNDKTWRSKTLDEAGKHPVWSTHENQFMEIDTHKDDAVHIECWD